ncbi:MAG: Transglutaminase domain-containing protein [uncultured Thiotrichaceae bacterium]|uniref:Transglutaminase domain-containing protein n=1 Tax=uncultured Thiotrichaceae bacterium TaxID=298394 RepID=A0A6S6SZ53_9GAMM|nr:MAG: Transglutaminase domain-containing protein [uncultured Thiotrichaceae bacterium]
MVKTNLYKRAIQFVYNRNTQLSLIFLSILLLTINFLGIAFPPQEIPDRSQKQSAISGYDYTLRSNTELLSLLESPVTEFNIDQINNLIYESIFHSDKRFIDIQENWLLWSLGQLYPPLARIQNPKRIIEGGGGLCSEVTAVFNEIAMKNNYETRFIDVNGHVVAEIKMPDGWKVVDPDYGISYDYDRQTLEGPQGASIISRQLASRNFSKDVINAYIAYFQSIEDNTTSPINQAISPRLYWVETTTEWLKWIIPITLFLFGYQLMQRSRKTRPTRMPNIPQEATI